MYFALEKSLDYLSDGISFWERYETEITIGAVLLALIVFILLVKFANRIKTAAFNRSHVKVNMYGHKTEVIKKGSRFDAPYLHKNGLSFGGWFIDTALTVPWISTKVKHDISIYPKWNKL